MRKACVGGGGLTSPSSSPSSSILTSGSTFGSLPSSLVRFLAILKIYSVGFELKKLGLSEKVWLGYGYDVGSKCSEASGDAKAKHSNSERQLSKIPAPH